MKNLRGKTEALFLTDFLKEGLAKQDEELHEREAATLLWSFDYVLPKILTLSNFPT